MKLLIIFISFIGLLFSKEVSLMLRETSDESLEIDLPLGSKIARMKINLATTEMIVCCKSTSTIFLRIYYILYNLFLKVSDYQCQQQNEQMYSDSIKLDSLGLVKLEFKQVHYPDCYYGTLGLSKKSYFLSLLPNNLQNFILSTETTFNHRQQRQIIFGNTNMGFYSFQSTLNEKWELNVTKITYNQILLGSAMIRLTTDELRIQVPFTNYKIILNELTEYYSCSDIKNKIYCPCQTINLVNYPSFKLHLSEEFIANIHPSSYMSSDAEVCEVLLKYSDSEIEWIINILLLNQEQNWFKSSNLRYLYSFQNKFILMPNSDSWGIQNESSKIPIQLFLNCFVILLMCLFISIVLIELIKRMTQLDEAQEQPFELRSDANQE